MLELLVDTREQRFGAEFIVYNNLNHKKDVKIIEKCQTVGDYATKDMVIERKEIHDFAGSIIDGRLVEQRDKLLEDPRPYKAVLIHGSMDELISETGIHPNSVLGMMASLFSRGITVLWLPSHGDMVYELIYRCGLHCKKQTDFKRDFKSRRCPRYDFNKKRS